MRIGLITAAFPPEGTNGGLASFYSELAKCLCQAGHEVLVVTLTGGADSEEIVDGARVVRRRYDPSSAKNLEDLDFVPALSYSLPRAIGLFNRCAPSLDAFKPDVIECAEHGAPGLLWAAQQRYPLVIRCICPQFHLMETGFSSNRSAVDLKLVTAAESYVIERASALATPSRSLAQIISRTIGLPLERLAVIPNPLTEQETAAATQASIFPENSFPKLLFVGRVEHLKGVDLLVEALPQVLSQYPNAHLSLVGSQPASENSAISYADLLRHRLTELGLAQKATFVDVRPRGDIPSLVRSADLCVFPSRYDSSPYACLESMLAGGCVIATDIGGIPEYVTHRQTGWLVDSESPQSLAQAILDLSGDRSLRVRISESGRQHITAQCHPERIAKLTLALYREAIDHFSSSQQRQDQTQPTRALQFLLEGFGEFSSGRYVLDRLDQTYARAASETWDQAYAAGIAAERARRKNMIRALPRKATNVLSRILTRIKGD